MKTYSLSHLSDGTLLRDLATLVVRERATTAELLAHIAEVDARKLYLPAGYPSMYAYCVEELRLSEDGTSKRIQAAREAREFPDLFAALADGRLTLSGVCLLAPHLTTENAFELLVAASGKSKLQIEALVAQRFTRSEALPMVHALSSGGGQHAPGHVAVDSEPVREQVGAATEVKPRHSKMVPIADERFELSVTFGRSTHEKLRYAQSLLSHQVPNGHLAEVLDRVLDLAIGQLEKRKFASTDRPRPARRSNHPRTIPAHVKRAVWQRDAGQCTFVGSTGHRCAARHRLEFDHVDPVACGGQATVSRIRLRCRAHNQYVAERAFGSEFMRLKRQKVGEERAAAAAAAAKEKAREVIPWLRALGIRADDARRAAERCETIPDTPLEERVKMALSSFGVAVTRSSRST